MTETGIDRRLALKMLGAVATTPLLSQPIFGLAGYHPQVPAVEADHRWRRRFLTEQELLAVEELAEILIPQTETAGARAALVHQYIDFTLSRESRERVAIRSGLVWLETRSRALAGTSFPDLDPAERAALVTRMADPGSSEEESGKALFAAMKRLVIRGYYRSEAGMHDELDFAGQRHLRSFEGCTHPEHQNWRPTAAATKPVPSEDA